MKKTLVILMCFLFLGGCLCDRKHADIYVTTAPVITPVPAAAPKTDMTSLSDVKKMMNDKGFKGADGYETNLDTVKSGLKDGESAVIFVNDNHYIGVTKEAGNKYLVRDADINNGKPVEYSAAEFNKLMSGRSATGVDKESGKAVITPAGYTINPEDVKVATNAEGIAQSGKSRNLSAYEMDNIKGSGAKEAIPEPAAPAAAAVKETPTVHFAFDSSKITETDKETLRQFAKSLKDKNYNITVQGHTDSIGTREYNQGLSERRAAAVKAELVRNGLDASRIETVGYGKDKPIATNSTAEGRAKNRRAVIFAETD